MNRTLRRRRIWIGVAAACVALGLALGLMYFRSSSYDPAWYVEDVALLRQFKQVDAQWELETLKLRTGLSDNYDALVDPPVRMRALQDELQAHLDQRHGTAAALEATAQRLRDAVAQKSGLIEDFKSHNAVLRNSVSFLPTAARDLLETFERARPRGRERRDAPIAEQVNKVLLDSMVFSQLSSNDLALEVQASLDGLGRHLAQADPPVAAKMALFGAHVVAMLREHAEVEQLLREIASVPTAERIDELDRQLSSDERLAAAVAARERLQVFVFAGILTALSLYAAANLVRSHAEILRVNGQLVDANATLEVKVHERTAALQHLATHDVLTQLPNRALLMDRLAQALAFSARSGRPFVVAAIDLDRFKWVNDSLGHCAGDALLRIVSRRILGVLRGTDTLARVGGDEFVAVLHDLPRVDDAIAILTRVVDAVAQPMVLDDGVEIAVSCSIGCASSPEDGADADELLRAADAAMYRAKESGRNMLQIFNADLRDRAAERARLETDLRHAIERGELALVYQPQIDLQTGALCGFEALLRWQHPALGTVSPAQFIPIAESSGLIIPIGAWVLDTACRQMRAWLDAGLAPVRVAVNLSAKQLARPGLTDIVEQCLAATGIDPARLELELTETASMDDPETTIPLLGRLKALGVSLSIDDFGTGYSNMQYLTRLPIDTLKLDGSFVREITTDPGRLAIAEAIVSMAHRLELRVVAEMTETEGQVVLLGSLGCDMAQGYFFSRPLPPLQCVELLRAGRMALPETVGRLPEGRAVLVVDDDIVITTAVGENLRREGYRVLTANAPAEAFELLARHQIDVVLSDQCMPKMTGVAFLSAVKRLYPATTRVIFSAQSDFDAALGAINQGAVHKFLLKPLQPKAVQQVLDEVFGRRAPAPLPAPALPCLAA